MEDLPTEQQPPSRRTLYIVLATIGAVVVIVLLILIFMMQKSPQSAEKNAAAGAETKFYGALANAAKQQKLRVGMYRETFANKADADSRQNVGTIASSLSEIDTEAAKYRSVFAYNFLQNDNSFSVGRCLDGTSYNDYYQPPATRTDRAKTLDDAASRLQLMPQGNLFKVTEALTYISCPHIGLLPASPPLPVARLSDGVMPVTLSDSQAAAWQKKLIEANLFTVKDEGVVDRNGQKLHKFSFAPSGDQFATNKQLYDIFYQTGEVQKIKSEHPTAEVDYEFQSINPINSGGIGGYYLIDMDKNLPVYSELYGTNPDKKVDESGAAKRNIAHTKQTYSYPDQPTIDLNTPLEFLN